MEIHVELAKIEEKPLLRGLLYSCLSELSLYGEVDAAYPYFDSYWDVDERRWPYVVRKGRETLGLALVNNWSPSGKGTDFAFAEFYIKPEARGSGVGREAAKTVIKRHAGVWELSIMSSNQPAKRFWPKVLDNLQASMVEKIEARGETIYRFAIG